MMSNSGYNNMNATINATVNNSLSPNSRGGASSQKKIKKTVLGRKKTNENVLA
jgi:hypothetical protein